MKKTISVDFDGTIVEHAFPEIGDLKPGVKDALTRLSQTYEIVISSCRASALFAGAHRVDYVQRMKEFLDENQIPYDRIDMGNEGKIVAVAYIDDRGIEFKDNWHDIADRLTGVDTSMARVGRFKGSSFSSIEELELVLRLWVKEARLGAIVFQDEYDDIPYIGINRYNEPGYIDDGDWSDEDVESLHSVLRYLLKDYHETNSFTYATDFDSSIELIKKKAQRLGFVLQEPKWNV